MEKGGAFIWTILTSIHQNVHCAKFGWNWPSGFGEENFLISSMYFGYLCNYLPLEKGGAFHLNKLESPSPKDGFCQVWRRWKCEKVTTTITTTTTDNGQFLIRKDHLYLRLRWAKMVWMKPLKRKLWYSPRKTLRFPLLTESKLAQNFLFL